MKWTLHKKELKSVVLSWKKILKLFNSLSMLQHIPSDKAEYWFSKVWVILPKWNIVKHTLLKNVKHLTTHSSGI